MSWPRLDGLNIELEHRIATSAETEIWSAQDVTHDRQVAIKVFKSVSTSAAVRLEAELAAIQGLSLHPHIVSVYGAALTDEGDHCLILQYVEGGSLADRAVSGAVGWQVAVRWVAQALEAIAYCHEQGVCHGDLKPSNILLDATSSALITDFDAATLVGDDSPRSRVTLSYAAPETLRGQSPTPATDMYAVGAILHELIAGSPPLVPEPGESVLAFARKVDTLRYRAPESCPPGLADLITRLLDRDPVNRPSAGTVAKTIGGMADVTVVAALRTRRGRNRVPPRMIAGIGGGLILAFLVFVFGLRPFDASESSDLIGQTSSPGLTAVPLTAPTGPAPEPTTTTTTTATTTTSTVAPALVRSDGVTIRRLDIGTEVGAPVVVGEQVWVVTSDVDGSSIRQVGSEESVTLGSGVVTDPPTTYGDYVLVPFAGTSDIGVALFSTETGRLVDSYLLPNSPNRSEPLPGTPVWLGPQPGRDTFIVLPFVEGDGEIYDFFGFPQLQDVAPVVGPGRAVVTPEHGEGYGVVLYEIDNVMWLQKLPVAIDGDFPLQLSPLPNSAGEIQRILHPAPDGSLWITSRERIVTRVVPDLEILIGGPLFSDAASVNHAEAGPCPIEDLLAGCREISEGGQGLIAFGGFWVANRVDGMLYRVDLETMEVSSAGPVGSNPGTPVATTNRVWIADLDSGLVSAIDTETLEVVAQTQLPCPEGTCDAWPEGVEWKYRALGVGDTVWMPWRNAIYSIETTTS